MSLANQSGFDLTESGETDVQKTKTLNEPVLPRIAAGDTTAVKECLDRYGSLVWSLARRMTSNSNDAEDAVQEVFIQLWQNASRFQTGYASEPTFVAMIARRRLIDRLRRAKVRDSIPSLSDQDFEPQALASVDRVELSDEVAKAMHCLEKLTSSTQQVLQLSIHDGISYPEISSRLSIPLGTVKSFARRGLLSLRDCMSRTLPRLSQEQQA